MVVPEKIQNALTDLNEVLNRHAVSAALNENVIAFTSRTETINFFLDDENCCVDRNSHQHFISADQLVRVPQKLAGIILSKLNLNARIFARNCEVKRINRLASEDFLNTYHLLGSTVSASNFGLFYKDELLSVASFSKGRRMNRLALDKRSFELIRFCCKPGVTITGGLTKLVKSFYTEKAAGDIMTYLDKQLTDGKSFITAGFKKHSETSPNYFLINKKTFERLPLKNKEDFFDENKFYLTQNAGNIKMIYQPFEKL